MTELLAIDWDEYIKQTLIPALCDWGRKYHLLKDPKNGWYNSCPYTQEWVDPASKGRPYIEIEQDSVMEVENAVQALSMVKPTSAMTIRIHYALGGSLKVRIKNWNDEMRKIYNANGHDWLTQQKTAYYNKVKSSVRDLWEYYKQ
jgi:hypothetical protein